MVIVIFLLPPNVLKEVLRKMLFDSPGAFNCLS
jgi:hypothetical protein